MNTTSTTTKRTTKAPALLTDATMAEVSTALLRHATRYYEGASLVEHQGVIPPVGPEQVTYRLGPLEVEELRWSAGGAKVSQRIDVWVPEAVEISVRTGVNRVAHAELGEIEERARQARLGDGTTVLSGVYTVEVFPFVPLIEGREEQDPRVVFEDQRRGRKVTEVGPIEGTPEHRHQYVKLSLSTGGDVRGALQKLRGTTTSAGRVARVGELDRWADVIGDSIAAATPSRNRVVVLASVRLEWREA